MISRCLKKREAKRCGLPDIWRLIFSFVFLCTSLYFLQASTPVVQAANIGFHAKSLEWIDGTHIRATYDWTDDSQLLDWTPTTGETLTRGTSTVLISGGTAEMHGMKWNLPLAVSRIVASHDSMTSNRTNIITNTNAEYVGQSWGPNPGLGVAYGWNWVVNGDGGGGSPPAPTANTWRDYDFTVSTTQIRTKSSVNDVWYTLNGSFSPTTTGYVALGSYNDWMSGNNAWGRVIIEGEVSSLGTRSSAVTLGSSMLGATSTQTITFTTATQIPNLGKIVVTYPAGFDVSGANGLTAGSLSGLDGTWTASVSGQVVTFTQTGGGISAVGAKSLTIAGIRNPLAIGGTGTYAIATKTPANASIDTDAIVAQSTIVAADASASIIKSAPAIGGVGDLTLSLALPRVLTVGEKINITFPASYAVSQTSSTIATTGISPNGNGSTLNVTASGQILTLTVATASLNSGNVTITIPGRDAIPQSVDTTDITVFNVRTASDENIATDSSVPLTDTPSPDKALTVFDFLGLSPTVSGVITEASHTIALTVPFGTDLTALVPTVTITGASVSPASGVARDFTSSQTYTVTANDASTQGYAVTVTVSPDPASPSISAFSIPSTSDSLTVPISSFMATDNAGVTGYLVTESSTAPASGDAGWLSSAPSSYLFASKGSVTLYAWAKDAAGNVSTSLSASVLITIGAGGGAATVVPPSPQEVYESEQRTILLESLNEMHIPTNTLVKLKDDWNPNTTEDTVVYYIGTDGKRHIFPNENVYRTWYTDFSNITSVSSEDLASIPLGDNVRYKPGVRMVKFQTDPKCYAVSEQGILRWVMTEETARALYGSDWSHQIDDLSDAFFMNYSFGETIFDASEYSVNGQLGAVGMISEEL